MICARATVSTAQAAFASAERFSKVAQPALVGLIPQAQALQPALKANARFFEQTTTPIRTQIQNCRQSETFVGTFSFNRSTIAVTSSDHEAG